MKIVHPKFIITLDRVHLKFIITLDIVHAIRKALYGASSLINYVLEAYLECNLGQSE